MSLKRFWRRRSEDAELAQEMEAHLAHEIDDNMARGASPEEARRLAYLKLGSPRRVREEVWQWNTLGFVEGIFRDLRYAARTLSRARTFAVAAILVMALGIGANTALFSIVRSVLLKPLPFPQPDRLMMLYEQSFNGKSPYNWVAPGMFAAWRRENHSFEQMALFLPDRGSNLSGSSGQLPERVSTAVVSWNLFSTLGVKAAYGRVFASAEDRPDANATVVLSWGLWKRRFAGDSAMVGKAIMLNAQPYTVIGIMPAGFAFPSARTQLWTPIYHEMLPSEMEVLDNHSFLVIGRLKPGVRMAQAKPDLSLIERRLHDTHPHNVIGIGANIRPLLDGMAGDYKTGLYVLLGATECLLLIACLNVANLLVARSAARRREVAILNALGGSRARLLREQMAESVMLALPAGSLGLALAYFGLEWFARTRQDMARVESIHIDGVALGFALGITLLSAMVVGFIGAIPSLNKDVFKVLQESSRSQGGGQRRAHLRKVILAVEVALTVVLLVGAGLLLKTYQTLRSADLGCATDNILTMRLDLPEARYKQPAQITGFLEQLVARVRALPGVEKAGLVTTVPGGGYGGDSVFTIQEHPPLPKGQFIWAIDRSADPGYFATMNIPLLRGRAFTDADRLEQANKVLISDLFVRSFFAPGENPIGKHLHIGIIKRDYEIVGIVGDTRYRITQPVRPMMYFPIYAGEQEAAGVSIAVHAKRDPAALALPIQKLIAGMDADLPVSSVLTMNEVIGQSVTDASFNATLLLGFALLSLLLASVGLYGVLSYLVAQRTGEIGIRLALGAQRGSVVRLMLMDGLKPACAGLVCGLAGAGLATRLVQDMLYGAKPLDAGVFAAVALLLAVVAAAACFLPAWRASRLDAMQALRAE